MKLTRFTDLGLRVLMYLTEHKGDEPVTTAELATQFEVSQHHVVKVIHRLGKLGWLDTQRGRGGGVRLGVAPASLRLGHVVRTLEAGDAVVDCSTPPCPLRGGCLLKQVLDQSLEAFYAALDEHTLAEVHGTRTAVTLIALSRRHRAA